MAGYWDVRSILHLETGGGKLEEVIAVKTTRRHGQPKHNLNIHHRENLKSYVPLTECRIPCLWKGRFQYQRRPGIKWNKYVTDIIEHLGFTVANTRNTKWEFNPFKTLKVKVLSIQRSTTRKNSDFFLPVRLRAAAIVHYKSKTLTNTGMEHRLNDIGMVQRLKRELHINIIHQFSSNLAVNTLRLQQKDRPVTVVWRSNPCLFMQHIHCAGSRWYL